MNDTNKTLRQIREERLENTLAEYHRIRSESPTCPAQRALKYAEDWAKVIELENEFDIRILIQPEDRSPVGEMDEECSDFVLEQIESGNEWAWCQVEVCVQHNGMEASDYLGGCSYRDETEFKKGGYYLDMIRRCLDDLNQDY